MIYWAGLAAILLSFALCALAVPLFRGVANRFNFLDFPQRHKAHAQPVPLLGGSAILLAARVRLPRSSMFQYAPAR